MDKHNLSATRFKVGDRVILGRHEYLPEVGASWAPAMDHLVGTVAIIKERYDHNIYHHGVCWLVHGNNYFWREANMRPADDNSVCLD